MIHPSLTLPVIRSPKNIAVSSGSIMALRGIESSRVALIISPSIAGQSDVLESILKNIRSNKLEVIPLNIQGELSLNQLELASAQIEQSRPDTIIALGGGSVLDAAKLIWLLYEHPDIDLTRDIRPNTLPSLRGRARFIAVPTTTGSGSEVSSAAVVYVESTQRKVAVVTHDFIPDLVVLDSNLLMNLPGKVIASTACDALSHAIEGYVSRIDNPLMDLYAEKAVQTIFSNWKAAVKDHDVTAISKLQYAATLAGWVQNICLVGASHAIGHQLGANSVPHSTANAILLPTVIRTNAQDRGVQTKYEQLAVSCGLSRSHASLAESVEEIRYAGAVEEKLSAFGVENLEGIIEGALLDPAAKTNPVEMDEDYILKVVKACL